MTEETRILKVFEPFILGNCLCGCNTDIGIRIDNGRLRKYVKGHHLLGKQSNGYKNGRFLSKYGYWYIYMPDYLNANVNGYVRENIYNFQEFHKCCMLKWGHVHHMDENRQNNMIWNLQGMTKSKHSRLHCIKNKVLVGNKYGKRDMVGRKCSFCDSDKTHVKKNGNPHWYRNNNEFLCYKCGQKRIRYRSKFKQITLS